MNRHIYLASPFFNEEQVARVLEVKEKLEKLGYKVYSPMHDSKVKLPANPSIEDAKLVFQDNVDHVISAKGVVAILDDYDTGTYFEIGLAISSRVPVVGLIFDTDKHFNDPRSSKDDDGCYADFDYVKSVSVVKAEDLEYGLSQQWISVDSESSRTIKILAVLGATCNDSVYKYFELNSELSKLGVDNANTLAIARQDHEVREISSELPRADYIILDRSAKGSSLAKLWGEAYNLGVPVISLSTETRSNLMLQPSTTYNASDIREVAEFIAKTKDMTRHDIISKFRGNGLLGTEEVI